jgi:PAS domain S-box-containing protein
MQKNFFDNLFKTLPEPKPIFVKMMDRSKGMRDLQIDWNYKKGKSGDVLGLVCLVTDITDRQKAEEKISEQASLLDFVADAIFVQDINDKVLFWNKGAEIIFGWSKEESIGKKISKLIFKDTSQYQKLKEIVLQQQYYVSEIDLLKKEGKEIFVETRCSIIKDSAGIPRSILAVMTDITEKRAMQRQYLRAQRMESLGTLASGIAHDLNNVLTPIMGSIQLLGLKLNDEKSKTLLRTLDSSVERGSYLIKQILTFARGHKEENITIDLKQYIMEIVKILKHTFPKNINIIDNISKDLANIYGDPTQIHQVLMNICVNAKDAMPNGGNLSFIAENTFIDENYSKINSSARIGPYLIIAISDTGDGIPVEQQDKVFEPFYTTKDIGKGTGLGLSTAYSIIKSHGGFINLYSEVDKGTIFKIYLPASNIDLNEIKDEDKTGLPEGNGELILVVDDESSICEIIRSTLETFNYKVITANNGTEAISVFLENKNDIKAVIVDMVMPVMDGNATIQVLQMMNPSVKIIATSGFITNESIFHNKGINSILMKPFSGEKLLKTLKEVLSL